MPPSKTKKKTDRPVRFVKASQSGRRPAKRVVAKRAQARPASSSRTRPTPDADVLPDWRDLSSSHGSSTSRPMAGGLFAAVSTLRLALGIIALAAVITLYVGHVYATSELLTELEQLRRDNLALHLERNQVKADFDRVSGPATIAARARDLGLAESVPTGQPIRLDLR